MIAGAALGIAGTLVSTGSFKHELSAVVGMPSPRADGAALHDWAAVAPGRVEARTGAAKVSSQITANLAQLVVAAGDAVEKDEIVAALDDSEQLARLKSARSEVEFRQTERDNSVNSLLQNDRRNAEDAVADATDALQAARAELDKAQLAARRGTPNSGDITAKRTAVSAADSRLVAAAAALRSVISSGTSPKPTRTESALALARAELAAAQAAWQKTIVRAPFAGRVLRTCKITGELAAATPEDPIIALGDLASLRVRAELDERDVGKIEIGQTAHIKTDALPEYSFKGRVSHVALETAPKKIGARQNGPQQTENVIEVIVDLEGGAPLLPGMRVDAFFEPTSVAGSSGDSYGTN